MSDPVVTTETAEDLHPGEYWRELIQRSKKSQADVSRDLDVSQKHLSQILCGKAYPSVHLVVALSDYFEVSDRAMWNLQCEYVLNQARRKRGTDDVPGV